MLMTGTGMATGYTFVAGAKAKLHYRRVPDKTTNDGRANLPVCLNLTASQRSDAGGTMGIRRGEHRFARSGGIGAARQRPPLMVVPDSYFVTQSSQGCHQTEIV